LLKIVGILVLRVGNCDGEARFYSTLVIKNGLYLFFKSDPECLERIESIEPLRIKVTGEAGFLAVPMSKAKGIEALELCRIDRSIWLGP